ncbi:MAG: hypothetical protein DBY02_05635 [Coprobacter fastidiosus]|nr:MAG: hypothetical protein DBY02_05635 [Coprobacter fastidiosus]
MKNNENYTDNFYLLLGNSSFFIFRKNIISIFFTVFLIYFFEFQRIEKYKKDLNQEKPGLFL